MITASPLKQNFMRNSMFEVKTLGETIADKGNANERGTVFFPFINEGDLAIVAGETNVGKSILCGDIAIANASNLCHWNEPVNDRTRTCLYVDGEMTDSQITQRYANVPEFALDAVRRASITPLGLGCTIDDKIENIGKLIKAENIPELVFVDNPMSLIDCMVSAASAKKVMEGLKHIKDYFGISMIVAAHFHKRNSRKAIGISDIQGSSVIANYADSVVAIGNSCKDPEIKYLKQLKSRSSRINSEVAVLRISEEPYLHFDFLEFDQEENHLIEKQESRSSITEFMAEHIMRLSEEGCSVRTISKELGISKSVVGRFIKNHK